MADEEEELALEKQKNLEILNSLLHIHLEHPKRSKQTANARKFKYGQTFDFYENLT